METSPELRDARGALAPDRPWIFRTYAGHTTARASNALFRANLARGQTGLSIAFDLPTQCGYDSDHPLARPEVGKVGVPINSIDDMRTLFDGIPLDQMNTSMTINATSMWLLALYVAVAEERGVAPAQLRGTTQNDLVKEYLARGTYIFPPEASLRLVAEMFETTLDRFPKWNPANVCSYHLQEAGATPAQELAFALATAVDLLDALRERGRIPDAAFPRVVGRVSFFVNSGIRFVEELCKMRAFTEMWDEICATRYGVTDPKLRRFRYGVQVNSLGLTEQQPENNAWRILLETLGVTLSRNARCRALQLPAWNEALSLPRPWDQQWSLRLQQILAHETDLLEYPDLFDGSPVIAAKVDALKHEAHGLMEAIAAQGGMREAIASGFLKRALVRSMTERVQQIQDGSRVVVGVNRWTDGLPSPLVGDGERFAIRPDEVAETRAALDQTRTERDASAVAHALARLRECAVEGEPLFDASLACARARVTTGEWADTLRDVFGEYRPPTGIDGQSLTLHDERLAAIQAQLGARTARKGRRPRLLVGKPGLDGHSNGAEVIAVAARHAGFDVIYAGIRLPIEAIAASAVDEDVDLIGLSILSGSHLELAEELRDALAAREASDIPVVMGGILPAEDHDALRALGVREVFTPSDYDLTAVLERLAACIADA